MLTLLSSVSHLLPHNTDGCRATRHKAANLGHQNYGTNLYGDVLSVVHYLECQYLSDVR